MAQKTKKLEVSSATPKQPTAEELRNWWGKYGQRLENFKKAEDGLLLLKDYETNTKLRTQSTYSKESLREYLKNISNNESRLRGLSRYLYYRCK